MPFGQRELKAEAAWTPGSIPAGGSVKIDVPLPGARPGDFAQSAFSLSTSGAVFMAQVGAQDVITVTAWNRTAAAFTLNAGMVRVRVVKS